LQEVEQLAHEKYRDKEQKKAPRRIRDAGTTVYRGTPEAGEQKHMKYVLLVPGPNDTYLVQPVGAWWKYKKHVDYQTLSTEQAEELMESHKRESVPRWAMAKMKKDQAWEEEEKAMLKQAGIEVGEGAKTSLVGGLDNEAEFEAGAGEGEDAPEGMDFDGGAASDDEGQEGLEMDVEKEDISGDEKEDGEKALLQVGEQMVGGFTGVETTKNEEEDCDLKVEGVEEDDDSNPLRAAVQGAKAEERAMNEELGRNDFTGALDEDLDDDKNDWLQGFIENNVEEQKDLNEEQAAEKITGIGAAPTLDKKSKKRKADTGEEAGGVAAAASETNKKVKVEQPSGAVTPQQILAFIRSKPAETVTSALVLTYFKARLTTKEEKAAFAKVFKSLPIKTVTKDKKKYLRLE